MTTNKICTKCGATKPPDEYHRDKNRPDGRVSECKTCVLEEKQRYYEQNREKLIERNRRYREANREEIAEKNTEQKRRYREKHPDYVSQQNRERHSERQRLTLYTAHRRHHPWTPDDDDMVLNSPMTVFQIAVALSKTYSQVNTRRATLRRKLTTIEAT